MEVLGDGDDVVLVHGALSWGRDTFATAELTVPHVGLVRALGLALELP